MIKTTACKKIIQFLWVFWRHKMLTYLYYRSWGSGRRLWLSKITGQAKHRARLGPAFFAWPLASGRSRHITMFILTAPSWRHSQDPWKCPKDPFPDPDRFWQNFHFSHSTVRIDFSKIWQKVSSIFPDRNSEKFLTFDRFRIKIDHHETRTC